MGIKVKYDPVGSAAMASYATGIGQGNERRDLQEQQLGLMEDRNLMGGRRLGGGFGGMPAGVAANPIAAKAWNEARSGIHNIERGRTFDRTLPATIMARGRLEDIKRRIEEDNPDPTPAEQALKNSYLGDATGNPVADGTPGAIRWTPDSTGKGVPMPWATVKPKDDGGAKAIFNMTVKRIEADSTIPSVKDPIDPEELPEPYTPTKEQLIQEAWDEYQRAISGAGAATPAGAVPAAPGAPPAVGGSPAAAADILKPYGSMEMGSAAAAPGAAAPAAGRPATWFGKPVDDWYSGGGKNQMRDLEILSAGMFMRPWKKLTDEEKVRVLKRNGQPKEVEDSLDAVPTTGLPTAAVPSTTPAGEGANPTPENLDPPLNGETPLQNVRRYESRLAHVKKGNPLRNREAFLADFMRRYPGVVPEEVTDSMLMTELIQAYTEMALGTSGSVLTPVVPTTPTATERQTVQSQLDELLNRNLAAEPPAVHQRIAKLKARIGQLDLMERQPSTAPPAAGAGAATPAAAPASTPSEPSQPRQRPAGSSDTGTSKQLFELSVRRHPKMKDHPLVKSALVIFAKQKPGIAFSQDDAWIIYQANEIMKTAT